MVHAVVHRYNSQRLLKQKPESWWQKSSNNFTFKMHFYNGLICVKSSFFILFDFVFRPQNAVCWRPDAPAKSSPPQAPRFQTPQERQEGRKHRGPTERGNRDNHVQPRWLTSVLRPRFLPWCFFPTHLGRFRSGKLNYRKKLHRAILKWCLVAPVPGMWKNIDTVTHKKHFRLKLTSALINCTGKAACSCFTCVPFRPVPV